MATNQIKAGIILSYVIIGLTMLTGILFTPIKLRLLGQSEFGMYALAASVIGYLSIFDFGFGNAIIRYTAKYRAEGKVEEQYRLWGMFLKLYIAIGVATLILGIILAFNTKHIFSANMTDYELQRMQIIMLLLAFNLAINFPFNIFPAIISAYENFIYQRCLRIAIMLTTTFATLALLLLGYKALSIVIITSIMNVICFSFNTWYCFNKLKIKIIFGKIDIPLFKEISLYSFWVFLNAIVDKFYWSTGQFVLGIYNGTKAIAIYALAIQLKVMYFNFSGAIVGVLFPKITAMSLAKDSEKQLSNLFIKTGRLQFILISFITSGFIVLGCPFIILWAGSDYEASYYVTLVLFLATIIPLIQSAGISILQAKNRMEFRSLLISILSLISVILMIILSKNYGALGCAWVIFGAIILGQGIILNIYYTKCIKLDIIKFWGEILKMSIAPIILTLISLYLIRELNIKTLQSFIIYATLFSIVYFILFWKFSMNNYEQNLFKNLIKKN